MVFGFKQQKQAVEPSRTLETSEQQKSVEPRFFEVNSAHIISIGTGIVVLILFFLKRRRILYDLKDKHVVITGGSSGIGKALAFECLEKGAVVTLMARKLPLLKEVKSELEQQFTTGKVGYLLRICLLFVLILILP